MARRLTENTKIEIRDLFVGLVATIFGVIFLLMSLRQRGWCFQLTVVKAIAANQRKTRARIFVGFVGACLLIAGLYLIILPWLPTPNQPAQL